MLVGLLVMHKGGKQMIIDTIKVLKPDEGMKLTDGNMIYDAVLLPKNRTKDEFSEITKEEAEELQKERDESNEYN